jgi:hypothetical protein
MLLFLTLKVHAASFKVTVCRLPNENMEFVGKQLLASSYLEITNKPVNQVRWIFLHQHIMNIAYILVLQIQCCKLNTTTTATTEKLNVYKKHVGAPG